MTRTPIKPISSPLVDRDRSLLKHEKIRAALMAEIAQGRLRPGDALPTEHQLAEMMEVSRSTVRQTLGDLEKDGIVRRVRGKGTFVTSGPTSGPTAEQSSKTPALAIVLPDSRSGYFPSLQHGFGSECHRSNQHMVVCDTAQDIYQQSDVILRLIDQRVHGVAIVPLSMAVTPPHHIRPLQEQGIPVVFCHRRPEGVKAPLVTFSSQEVGRAAGCALAEHGHRRIAYFGTHRYATAEKYETGLRDAIGEFGGTLLEEHVYYGEHTHGPISAGQERSFGNKLQDLLSKPNPPTAIMVSFDSLAESMYFQLDRLGIQVPDDISLISFGGKWREGAIARQLTSVTVDETELGRQAANLLNEMRDGSRKINCEDEIVLPLGLSEGQTLAIAR